MKPLLAALAAAALATGSTAVAQTGNRGGSINDNLGAPDYGVCRGLDPKCFHDWARAAPSEYRILLFTRTGGPRHASNGPALGPGLNPPLAPGNAVHRGMLDLARKNGWKLDYTEDLAVMTQLSGYHAVIFYSTSRDTLDDNAKTALRQYMRAGGGFIGVHNAFGTMYNWPWYEGLLGGANFYDHGPYRDGDVVTVGRNDASTRGLPTRWAFKDEWYNLVPFPTGVRFLATVDEKSWKPVAPRTGGPGGGPPGGPQLPRAVGSHPGHGDFHPVAWCQYYDGGKAWLTTLGHDAAAFSPSNADYPGAEEFQRMLTGAVRSVMGAEPFCR